jgi:hypothetical protein
MLKEEWPWLKENLARDEFKFQCTFNLCNNGDTMMVATVAVEDLMITGMIELTLR